MSNLLRKSPARYNMVALGFKWSAALCAVSILVSLFVFREELCRWGVRSGYLHLDRGYTVRLVIPVNYRGVVEVAENREAGVPPRIVGKLVEYIVPQNGYLKTADVYPLLTWHRLEGRYADGSELAVEGQTPDEKDGVLLRGLASTASVHLYIVGTKQDKNTWWANYGREQ